MSDQIDKHSSSSRFSDCTLSQVVIERVIQRLGYTLLPERYLIRPRTRNNTIKYSSGATPPYATWQLSTQSSEKALTQSPCMQIRLVQTDDISKPSMFPSIANPKKKRNPSSLGANASSSSNTSMVLASLGFGGKITRKRSFPVTQDLESNSCNLIKSSPIYNKYSSNLYYSEIERAIYSDSDASMLIAPFKNGLEDYQVQENTPPKKNRYATEFEEVQINSTTVDPKLWIIPPLLPSQKPVHDAHSEPPRVRRQQLYDEIRTARTAHLRKRKAKTLPQMDDIPRQFQTDSEVSSEKESTSSPSYAKVQRTALVKRKTGLKCGRTRGRARKPRGNAKKKSIRSKSGCWTCRIRHKACPENRPECNQCTRLNLKCDFSAERPEYMHDPQLRAQKLSEIKFITSQQKSLSFINSCKKRKLSTADTLQEDGE